MADAQKIAKMVEKKQWSKLQKKYVEGSQEERLALAQACASVSCDESVNILIALMQDEDAQVQLAAVQSLGKVADDHATSRLQTLLLHAEKGGELYLAVEESIRQVRRR